MDRDYRNKINILNTNLCVYSAASLGNLYMVKCFLRGLSEEQMKSCINCKPSPLLSASLRGHTNVVECLLERGADLEVTNMYGHNSLMLACCKGHFDVAKYLIDHGADINTRSVAGRTGLHACAAHPNSLDVIEMLLKKGAKFVCDYSGATPLLAAAIAANEEVVKYFIQNFKFTKQDKINAIELLGAAFTDKKEDLDKARYFWRQGIELRYEDKERPLEKPTTRSPIGTIIEATEVTSLKQLDELTTDEMSIQALLIRERILGPGHPTTALCVKSRACMCSVDKRIQLWMYSLDMLQKKGINPNCPVTESILHDFENFFLPSYQKMSYKDSSGDVYFPGYSFQNIIKVFHGCLKEFETAIKLSKTHNRDFLNTAKFQNLLNTAMHLIVFICKLKYNEEEALQLKNAVHHLVQMNLRGKQNYTPLHIACSSSNDFNERVVLFPSEAVVDLLLEAGACPNTIDISGCTPLHIIADHLTSEKMSIFYKLLKYGAHLDYKNFLQKTPLEIASNQFENIDICPLKYITLQCLCAQIIRMQKIPYKGIPKTVEKFVDIH